MEVDAPALWSRLPLEIEERVLSVLPVPDLCRCQSVCRSWKELICNPVFCASHAHSARCQEASFLVMRLRCKSRYSKMSSTTTPRISCILDLKAKRWYTVNDNYRLRNFSCVAAMNGSGLVCQDLWIAKSESFVNSLILVHNLLGNSARVLPITPVYWPSKLVDVKVKLAIDKDSQNFKIFLLNRNFFQRMGDDRLRNPLLRVYDSTSNGWKSSSNPSGPSWIPSELMTTSVKSSVMFQGFLHVLFCLEDILEYQLRRYNHIEDVWEKVEVAMILDHDIGLLYPELVVSANRLFLVAWYYKNLLFWTFGLREFIIPDMRSEAVFEIPEDDIIPFFGVKFEYPGQCPKMKVFGFGNSLAIMSKSSGELKVFDVVTRKWDQDDWPQRPMLDHILETDRSYSWFGEHVNLLLPNTPLPVCGGSSRMFSDLCSEIIHQL